MLVLDRVLDRAKQGKPISPQPGRPRVLQPDAIADLKARVVELDRQLSSLTYRGLVELIDTKRVEVLSEQNKNPNVVLHPVSRSTLHNIRKQIAPDIFTSASVKNPTRIRALVEIQNAITCAAVAAQFRDVPPETFLSTDAVGVRLGDRMDDKPVVYLAAGSRDFLLARNLLPATSKKSEQFRVVNCMITHSAAGQIVHCAILIKDETITEGQVHSISETLSVWLLPVSYDRSEFFSEYMSKYVIPELNAARAKLASLWDDDDEITDEDAESSSKSAPRDPKAYHRTRAVFSFDGEHAQVMAASVDEFLALCEKEGIELVKWAAAASMTEQPADVGRMHTVLHAYFKSKDGREAFSKPGNPSSAMKKFLEKFAKCSIPAASRDVFAHFLSHIEVALDKAFTMASIHKAWEIAGYFPFNIKQILSGYAHWRDLPEGDAEIVLQ